MTLFEEFYKSKEFNWKPGLERIEKAVKESNFKIFPSIIVAGTNGKGSTSHMIAEILRQNGLKVGLFTSPHLLRFNERIKVDMKEVDTETLDSSFKEIIPLVEEYQLTYFEASFLLSLKVFHDAKVDAAVFEVGLGGRLDATNALFHELAVITRVGLDHTDYLGNTLAEIAREKVAVIKGGIPAVISDNPPVVRELAEERTKELFAYGIDFKAEEIKVSPSGTQFLYNGKVIRTSLIGKHQAVNCATALTATKLFIERNFKKEFLLPETVNVRLPGRLEVIRNSPLIIFDVAHNVNALTELFKTLNTLGIRADVVFSSLKDKNVEENLRVVADYLRTSGGELYLIEIKNERGTPLRELLTASQKLGIKAKVLEKIYPEDFKKDTVITGSFYIAELIDGYRGV
ncbi:bifunctional folylpolyglutamate synthase/dihydrofolate synthase [Phorcysia thermohydrogeniphila]|uniref:Dihydrofolate synthase/folylpolyglutamate synthase n=1 Tax=Phorcysia thermohydrogeniphila TaxID=936138 RepID=A0A4R1GBS0_9BACT|nr:Mur ligase family protein [Phorcysia thermohydrogeniphila]TCK03945.1 dihydrofolate synthase/folylpolyglutamate synthase [Phorcysia thermohydrogeniphila]